MQNLEQNEEVRLTQFSHGAGCGCKIAPSILDNILKSNHIPKPNSKLLVGYGTRDDAAVYDLGNGTAVISTTDFFMPIVDDAFDFGRIASANAISDVYAMGGLPIMAIAVLGWPVGKIPEHVASQVLEGARHICEDAGIPLAGGHSIDSPEPIFGLAVTGTVGLHELRRNDTAKPGDLLYLTKPLGIGILSTAQKKGLITKQDLDLIVNLMTTLNKPGQIFGKQSYVHALTDVTGFGLLGHLSEMCEGASLGAELYFEAVPKIPGVEQYLAQGSVPGGTNRNWASYGHKIEPITDLQKQILADPQTSGGLLVAVDPRHQDSFEALARGLDLAASPLPIGRMLDKPGKISVK